MITAYAADGVEAVVTWNPLASEILNRPDATSVFDSSDIPGEIIDLMVVNAEVLEANPDFANAFDQYHTGSPFGRVFAVCSGADRLCGWVRYPTCRKPI